MTFFENVESMVYYLKISDILKSRVPECPKCIVMLNVVIRIHTKKTTTTKPNQQKQKQQKILDDRCMHNAVSS